MAQYYQYVFQSVDDIKQVCPNLNLENCLIMNEDGTPFGAQSVSDETSNSSNAIIILDKSCVVV